MAGLWRITLNGLFFSISLAVPALLGLFVIPLGTGPDELAHIDSSFFRISHSAQTIEVEKGLYQPGRAPLCQGHQPPLAYILNAALLGLFHNPENIGAFIDYQAKIEYSSGGGLFGGNGRCNYVDRFDLNNLRDETKKTVSERIFPFQVSIRLLRLFSVFLFGLSGLAAFLLAKELFPKQSYFALALPLLYLSFPNAIWRSIFVTNDNLAACLGAWSTLVAVRMLTRQSHSAVIYALFGALLAGLAFLTKYTTVPIFPCLLLAIFIKEGWTIRFKSLLSCACTAIFVSLIASDLLENLNVDGDLFSQNAIIHLAYFLHIPNTFLGILFDRYFISTLIERIWIEYHAIGSVSSQFPHSIINLWWILFSLGTLGAGLHLLKNNISSEVKRAYLYMLALMVLTIISIVHFGTKFPLPAGRYSHHALLALSSLIIFGITYWLSLLPRFFKTDISAFALACSFWSLGTTLTFLFLFLKYQSCPFEKDFNVSGGTVAFPLDLDGDGQDELAFFQRIRNRVFIARYSDREKEPGDWNIQPSLTRSFGSVADLPLVADISSDKKEDLLFWRPSTNLLTAADARAFLNHDNSISQYSDLAISQANVFISGPQTKSIMTCRKTEPGSRAEIFLFDSRAHNWHEIEISQSSEDSKKLVVGNHRELFLPSSFEDVFLMKGNKQCFLVGLEKSKALAHLRTTNDDSPSSSLKLPPFDVALPVDIDGDGLSEIFSFQKNKRCVSVTKLEMDSYANLKKQNHGTVCNDEIRGILNDDHQFFALQRNNSQGNLLGVFSRITGMITFYEFKLENDRLRIASKTPYNPGWLPGATLDTTAAPSALLDTR